MTGSPLVIVGAPRSGTNMLRDILTRLDGAATWPCDEINYVWRHGNARHPSDELTASLARPGVRAYIRRQFAWVARKYGADAVIEKTCANSLRVPFVDAVLPEARYVFIRRDGVDAVGSSMQRWRAKLDLPYLARKARFVPAADLPYYALRYLGSRAHRLVSREGRLAVWGPQLEGMSDLLAEHSLEEVCALQWQRCVELAHGALSAMPSDRWIEVVYEDFVRAPETELERIVGFLGWDLTAEQRQQAVAGVRADSIGKGRTALESTARERIERLVGDSLARYGYA